MVGYRTLVMDLLSTHTHSSHFLTFIRYFHHSLPPPLASWDLPLV
jgi:hypothetical protein